MGSQKWTKEQQEVIDSRDCNLLVAAAAGSGKTAVLVERIIKIITNKEKLVLICAASRGDVARVKQVAREIDSNSFIIIANAREVVGLGFKK